MTETGPKETVRLFYSYSHLDRNYQHSMERALGLLRQDGLLDDWSDRAILPGQRISESVQAHLDAADIVCFLLSQNFIASGPCMEEWRYAQKLAQTRASLSRVPIILTDCAWQDLLKDDDLKALPGDARPVDSYRRQPTAWQEIYEGLKRIVEKQGRAFTPQPEFLKAMAATDLVSQDHIALSDIFVFPNLTLFRPEPNTNALFEEAVDSVRDIIALRKCIIHGDEMSGKSSLAKHLFSSLAYESKPVLFVNLRDEHRRPSERVFRDIYRTQFTGHFHLWRQQSGKTIVLDNLTASSRSIEYVQFAGDMFDNVVVTTSSDVYRSFYKDDERLASFKEVRIRPLSHVQQERLIRRRLSLMDSVELTDGFVDHVEDRVNTIMANRIVPRYPFYVLAVIQTWEGFMPTSLSVTSYGHCYYVMILARLTRSGISKRDEDINACMNFAEHLALAIYERDPELGDLGSDGFLSFVNEYRRSFLIPDALLNRLQHREYGLISANGRFRVKYMYHYFLGMYLSKSSRNERVLHIVDSLCSRSHVLSNHLTLMFTIHHATDNLVLDKILEGTIGTLDEIEAARLDSEETGRFGEIVGDLSEDVLSGASVDSQRRAQRERRDLVERRDVNDDDGQDDTELVNSWYKILKNNRILGQVLRNRYGSLERGKLSELVETIADGGLRLVNSILRDEEEIADLAMFLSEANRALDLESVKRSVRFFSFLWTMVNVEEVVGAIGFREVREIVDDVVNAKSSPAYEVIGYFATLDGAEALTGDIASRLHGLLERYEDGFVRGVLSLRTQHYMNTHRSHYKVEQRVCSALGLRYRQRLMVAKRRV